VSVEGVLRECGRAKGGEMGRLVRGPGRVNYEGDGRCTEGILRVWQAAMEQIN